MVEPSFAQCGSRGEGNVCWRELFYDYGAQASYRAWFRGMRFSVRADNTGLCRSLREDVLDGLLELDLSFDPSWLSK